jgi:phage single-strand DNA binding protein
MNNTNTNFENNTDLFQRLIDAEVALQVKNKLEDINKPIDNSELFEALARAQANFDQVKKSGKANIPTKSGGNYSYNFAKLSDVLAATVPALNAEGIFFSQKPNYSLSSNAPTLTIVSTLSHKSGASISYESIPLFYNMNDAKQAGSIMTYLRRYGACQILGIEGDDDDDAHVATMNNSSNYNNYKSNQQTRQQAKQQSATKQGTSKPVASTQKPVEHQPKPEPSKSVEPVAEQTAEKPVETKPVEQVETQTSTVQSTHQTCPPSPEGQVQAEESVTESKETETVTIPQAPKRDMSAVFQSGLESAKHFGATEEQLAEWQAMTHEEAIREMSTFVRDKASGK